MAHKESMTALIDKEGFLHIWKTNSEENKKDFKKCPVSSILKHCGDWCPLFGIPSKVIRMVGGYDKKEIWYGDMTLKLCNRTVLEFNSLTDERTQDG